MEAIIDRATVAEITTHFQALSSLVSLRPICNKQEYERAVASMNQLLDAGAADEEHPLADLVTTIGTLIGAYEDAHNPAAAASPVAVLRLLMEQHRLTQSDLPEVGTQGVVSEILREKRELNARQIKALAQRFHVPPGLFLQ